jgi:hypothetical protein
MYFLYGTAEKFAPPHHICGLEAEKRDVVNWPYWKPYVREITSTDPATGRPRTVKTGRYWANGRLTWTPKLHSPRTLADFMKAENARIADGAIVAVDKTKPAILEWRTKLPYMLQGGSVRFDDPGADGGVTAAIAVALAQNERSAPASADPAFESLATSAVDGKRRADLRPSFVQHMGTREYTLRFELAGSARLSGLTVATIFQHNMYALPQLMPGRNEVRLTVANPADLGKTRLFLEYAWQQDGETVSVHHRIDRSPFTFTVTVPGVDFPRMRHLALINDGTP